MRRLVLVLAALVAASVAGPGSASADTGNFCDHVLIDSGHTCIHGNDHSIVYVRGQSTGSAVACVGLRWGPNVSDAIANGSYCSNPGAQGPVRTSPATASRSTRTSATAHRS